MRIPYKSFPYHNRAFPDRTLIWRPVVPIKLVYSHASTRKIDALVDTGSDFCLFHSSIGEAIGIKIKNGIAGNISGVLAGPIGAVYYHDVKLVVGQDMVEIKAGFTTDIVTPLLGQSGFFDNFLVTFDPSPHPPCFDIQRIRRN